MKKDHDRQQEALVIARETELRPILQFLQEEKLTGSNLDTLHDSFGRKGFSRDIVSKYLDEIKVFLGDDLIRLGLKIVPELYPNCESAKKFLAANRNIRPKLAVAHKNCTACTHETQSLLRPSSATSIFSQAR